MHKKKLTLRFFSMKFGSVGAKLFVSLIEILLVISLGFVASKMVINILDKTPHPTPVMVSKITDKVENKSNKFVFLKKFDPFFHRENTSSPQEIEIVQESNFELELFGLRAEANGRGNAIIKLQKTKQKLVKTGENIAPDIKLVGVYPDRIEILRGGVREAVYMYKNSKKPQAGPVSSNTKNTSSALTNIASILATLDWEAVKENNRIIGFRLKTALPATDLPLQANDILRKVNGTPINSYEALEELPAELLGAQSIIVEFDRRGERLTQTVNF